jgi:hypothetical protein
MENTSLTNEMMAGIAAQYSDAMQPPYERSIDELLKNGYSEMQMEICRSKTMIPFAGENIVENDDPSMDKGRSMNYRRIDFDRSKGFMRITEPQAESQDMAVLRSPEELSLQVL